MRYLCEKCGLRLIETFLARQLDPNALIALAVVLW